MNQATAQAAPLSPPIHMVLGQLYTNKVIDQAMLDAFANTPREKFVPPALAGSAYVDDDLPLGNGRFLIAALPFARMVQLAEITPQSKVLVIGSSTGYSLAVIASLAKEVVGCEMESDFVDAARKNLASLNIANARVEKTVTLTEGYAKGAPYDAIIIEGAAEMVPTAIKQMLSERGRLVVTRRAAVNGLVQGLCRIVTYVRAGKGFSRREGKDASLPLLPGFERKKPFVF